MKCGLIFILLSLITSMEISDSLGIKFWLVGQETYSQASPYGVNKKLFFQPLTTAQDIPLQFTDNANRLYKLKIFDKEDNLLQSIPFDVIEVSGVFVYFLTFQLTTYGINNKVVYFQISYDEYTYSISGGVTNPLPTVSGEMTFTPESLLFSMSGDITDTEDEVDGDILTSFSSAFKLGNDDETICDEEEVILYFDSDPFDVGTILYHDDTLTVPATGFDYVVHAGTIYNMNSATGEVGSGSAFCTP